MANSLIDDAAVMRLVTNIAYNALGPTHFATIGEPALETTGWTAYLVQLTIAPRSRNAGGSDDDTADVTAVFEVSVPPGEAPENPYIAGMIFRTVRQALDQKTADESSTTGHILHLHRAQTNMGANQSELGGHVLGRVTVTGEVYRVGGKTTFEVYPT